MSFSTAPVCDLSTSAACGEDWWPHRHRPDGRQAALRDGAAQAQSVVRPEVALAVAPWAGTRAEPEARLAAARAVEPEAGISAESEAAPWAEH